MRRFVCTVTLDSPSEQPLPPGTGTTDNSWRLSSTIRRLRRHSGTDRLVCYADRTGSRPTTAGKAPGDAKGAPFPSATRTGALFQRKSATEHGFYFGHGHFTLVATTTYILVKCFTCLDSPIMGSTNHAFDGGQSQGNTPYLLMICSLTGAHGRPQTCTDVQL